MNKLLDFALGWPGLVLFLILIFVGLSMTNGGPNPKTDCEAKGGRYVQTMKSYHTCKMPETSV